MTAYANAESYSDTLIHSRGLSSRDAGHEPNDSDPDGDTRTESELKTAVSPNCTAWTGSPPRRKPASQHRDGASRLYGTAAADCSAGGRTHATAI